jgi:hypothetical protein
VVDGTCRIALERVGRLDILPPLFQDIVAPPADEAGRLWVESTGPDGVGFLLGLIDSDGRLLGEGPMPDRDERVTPFARGDRLYVVTRDSLDVQGVQVYRVTPGS